MSQPPAMQFAAANPQGTAPFKSQIWKLNQEIEGFSRRVGGGGGPGETESNATNSSGMLTGGYRDKEEFKVQVGGLHQTMEQLNAHLERERIEKRQTQDELERLKLQMRGMGGAPSPSPSPVGQQQVVADKRYEVELKDKIEQIASLREEKAVMKEWLDRGVAECRRVAEEVTRLRKELEENDGEKGRLGEEKTRLEAMLQQVMVEVRETGSQLGKEKGDKEAALDAMAEKSREATASTEQIKLMQGESERLAGEVARLMDRVRDTEESEMQLRAFVVGLKRTSVGYLALHAAVEQDRMGDLIRFGENVKDDEAAGTGALEDVVRTGKGCLAELQDVLLALRSIIRGRIEESQERCAEVSRRETDQAERAVQGAHRVEQELRERHAIEKNLLEGKLLELEGELATLSDSNLKSQLMLSESEAQKKALTSHYDTAREAPMVTMTPTEGGDERLAAYESRMLKLEAQNTKLKEKNKKMKVDWGKVTDTRQYCQKLEVEKRTMQEYIEKMERENEALRRRGYQGAFREERMSPSKRHENDQSSAAWRDWQRAQTNWDAWKETRTTVPTFTSPNSRQRPRPQNPPQTGSTTSLYNYPPPDRVSPPRGSGPWMPSP